MPSLYLNRLSNQERERLVNNLHESQKGNCFICGQDVDLVLHAGSLDIDHIEPISTGGKERPENFALTHDSCNRRQRMSAVEKAEVLRVASSGLPKRKVLGELGVPKSAYYRWLRRKDQ